MKDFITCYNPFTNLIKEKQVRCSVYTGQVCTLPVLLPEGASLQFGHDLEVIDPG